MKKLLLLLLIVTTTCSAQITIHGRAVKTSVTPPPTSPKDSIKALFTHAYFVQDGKNRAGTAVQPGQDVATVPNANTTSDVGARSIDLSDLVDSPKTTIQLYNSNIGGLVSLDNEPTFYYSNSSDITLSYPFEVWFTGVIVSPFPNEAYLSVFGLYLSDLNTSILRTTNSATDTTSQYIGKSLPQYAPFSVRMLWDVNKKVTVYINGVVLGPPRTTFFTGTSNVLKRVGFGTNTNNAKWYASGLFVHIGQFTTGQATSAYNNLKALYSTEVAIPYPSYKSVNVTWSSTVVNAVGTYIPNPTTGAAEDASKRQYRWYGAGTGVGAPDVTNNHLVPTLNNLGSWNKSTHSTELANDHWFRVDIYCTDVNGVTFQVPFGCIYQDVTQ